MSLNDSELLAIARDRGVRLEGELLALTVERDNLRKMLEDARQQFNEAREIIAQVSYSPEFKKFHYLGVEQDPCGVHAFTAKYTEKPVPMCAPDPLEDIMPPVEGSGGCC